MIVDLVPRVRRALGVSSSYDNPDIPDIIRASCKRLLRDYHFPKSLRRAFLGTGPVAVDGNPTLLEDDDTFDLPDGFKRDIQVRFRDADEDAWSEPIQKRESFILPDASGTISWYWLEGTTLRTDARVDTDGVGKQLVLFYQSALVDAVNEAWLTEDHEDAVVYLSVMRGALEFRKPEVAKDYGVLWADERESLAIYLNELEWDNVVMLQREYRDGRIERYPASES